MAIQDTPSKTSAPQPDGTAGVTKAEPKSMIRRLGDFSRELWNDHDFWIRALAIKGGASAIVIAAVATVSYVLAFPFFIAAAGIAACGGLIALGLSGILLGSATAWDKLRDAYSRTVLGKPAAPANAPTKSWYDRLSENPRVQRLCEKPLMKKFLNSRVWKTTSAITKKQQDLFLTGMAGGGSIVVGTLSAITLVTQLVVLPVVAVYSIVTLPVVIASAGLLSGIYGIYLAGQNLVHNLGSKKKTEKTKTPAETAPQPQTGPQLDTRALVPAFTKAEAPVAPEEKQEKSKPIPPAEPPAAPPPAR